MSIAQVVLECTPEIIPRPVSMGITSCKASLLAMFLIIVVIAK